MAAAIKAVIEDKKRLEAGLRTTTRPIVMHFGTRSAPLPSFAAALLSCLLEVTTTAQVYPVTQDLGKCGLAC
jgi:hypothetical protein